MTTILKVNVQDVDSQFFYDLGQQVTMTTEIEIRIAEKKTKKALFTQDHFWALIQLLDWSKTDAADIIAPVVADLAAMPVVNLYLFEDQLAEKLYQLDTRQHAKTYLANEGDGFLSVDDFLYVRCAVIAEGKDYFERVLADATLFPADLTFEPLLGIAQKAYHLKTGRDFNYHAAISYETYSNKKAWM